MEPSGWSACLASILRPWVRSQTHFNKVKKQTERKAGRLYSDERRGAASVNRAFPARRERHSGGGVFKK